MNLVPENLCEPCTGALLISLMLVFVPVLSVSHGTSFLNAEAIERAYPGRHWQPTDYLINHVDNIGGLYIGSVLTVHLGINFFFKLYSRMALSLFKVLKKSLH